jgi:hypothetical protein
MRWGAFVISAIFAGLLVFAIGGCASQPTHSKQAKSDGPTTIPAARVYRSSPAGALVFNPPATLGQPPIDLSRDQRSPDAFVAYDSLTTTYFYIRNDDNAGAGWDHGWSQRRAISTKVGVSYR